MGSAAVATCCSADTDAESRMEYARVISEWEANGRRLPQPVAVAADLTVNELTLAYWRHAEGYYLKNGVPTSQLDCVRLSLKPLKELYGHTPARDFGPLALKAVATHGKSWLDPRLRELLHGLRQTCVQVGGGK